MNTASLTEIHKFQINMFATLHLCLRQHFPAHFSGIINSTVFSKSSVLCVIAVPLVFKWVRGEKVDKVKAKWPCYFGREHYRFYL